jgi:SnoaL-like domain
MTDANLHDLARRLRRLEDIEAIRRLKARYLNACDSQDPETASRCFADGKILIDMGHVGVLESREQFAALYRAAGCHPHILDMHHGTNSEIDFVDDARARGLWALEYRNINTRDKTVTFISGVYHDEYVKTDGEWQISSSRTEFKTALHCSYAGGTLEAVLAAKSVAGTVEYPKETA